MSTRLLTAQLLATRDTLMAGVAQIDASLLALGFDPPADDDAPAASQKCQHPTVEDHSTLPTETDDGQWYRCAACGAESPTLPIPTED